MAQKYVSILGPNVLPDTQGFCFPTAFDVLASNDLFKNLVWDFVDPSSGSIFGFYGQFTIPNDWVSGATIVPVWTTINTTGNARWKFSYRVVGGDDTTSLDQATFQESAFVTDAAPSAAFRRLVPVLTLTGSNFSANATCEYYFTRDNSGGTDTISAAAVLFDLLFQYSDT